MRDHIEPESRATPYFPALDGLRTIAVGMVFAVHYLEPAFSYGWLGVQIFFVLSGFLITGILFDTRHDEHRFRNFYVRRALRIFPLYYGVLLFFLSVLLYTHARLPQLFGLWWIYAGNFFWLLAHPPISDGLLTGSGKPFAAIGHLWSLAVEEQFYLLWPLVVFTVLRRRRLMQLSLLLIVCRCLLAAYWQKHLPTATLTNGLIYRMLPTQCDGFLIGGLLALWLRGTPSPRVLAWAGRVALLAVVLYVSTLAGLYLHPGWIHGQNILASRTGIEAVYGLPLANFVSGWVLLAATVPFTWVYRLCHLTPMRSLGRVSYGLYLFHLPIKVFIQPFLIAYFTHRTPVPGFRTVESLLCSVLTVGLAYASYYGYEKPFLRLKNRFTSHGPARQVTMSAVPQHTVEGEP